MTPVLFLTKMIFCKMVEMMEETKTRIRILNRASQGKLLVRIFTMKMNSWEKYLSKI